MTKFFINYDANKIYEMPDYFVDKSQERFDSFEEAKELLIEHWHEKQNIAFKNLQEAKLMNNYIGLEARKKEVKP